MSTSAPTSPPAEHARSGNGSPRTFGFTLYPVGPVELTNELCDRLFEAGCDDASPGVTCGVLDIPFDRAADSLGSAIQSAVQQVRSVGLEVDRIEIDRDDLALMLGETTVQERLEQGDRRDEPAAVAA